VKFIVATTIALIATIIQIATADLFANGNAIEIFSGTENRYDIMVGAQPKNIVVGTVHFTIRLFESDTAEAVNHAKILIVAHSPDGKPAYQVRAVNVPSSLEYYDANITFETPGNWKLVITLDHEILGKATFSVPVGVGGHNKSVSFAGTAVWLGVLLTLLGGTLFIWYRAHQQ